MNRQSRDNTTKLRFCNPHGIGKPDRIGRRQGLFPAVARSPFLVPMGVNHDKNRNTNPECDDQDQDWRILPVLFYRMN